MQNRFGGGLIDAIENPLVLGGLSLLAGGGFDGLNSGIRSGVGLQARRRQVAEEDQRKQQFEGLLGSGFDAVPPQIAQIARAAGPEKGLAILAQYADPMNGLRRKQAENELSMAPLDRKYKEAQINNLSQKAEPDPIEMLLLERLQGGGARPAPPAQQPGQPMLQPQSYNGAQSPQDLLQLTSDNEPEQTAPPVATEEPMIQTPFGLMGKDEARQLGGAMLLKPKTAPAGKAILDSIESAGGSGLSKPAETQLDERTISAASTLGRLQSIRQSFKPEFQQIPERIKLLGASWGASFGGKLSPELKKQLTDFAAFKASAFDNFNQLLKELSGTAVSAQELARQKIVQPNPGEGLFDGDDPVTFMSKIQQGEKIAKSAIARMNYMRTQGIRFNKYTAEQFLRLEDVPDAIDRRGSEIENQIKQRNPKADPMSIDKQVRQQLKREFGI